MAKSLREFLAWLKARPFWPSPAGPTIVVRGWRLLVRPVTIGTLRDLTKAGHVQAITAYQVAGLKGEPVTPEMESAFVDGALAVLSASLHRPREWLLDRLSVADSMVALALVYQASGFIANPGSDPKATAAP